MISGLRLAQADPGPVTRDGAAAAARAELAKPGYHSARPSALQRFVTWLLTRLDHIRSDVVNAVPAGGLGLLIIVAVIVGVVVLIRVRLGKLPVRELLSGRRDPRLRRTAGDYAEEAAAFRASGQHAEAIRASTRAMVRDLEDRGVLEPTPGSTASALSAQAARAVPAVGPDAALVAGVFDRVWYASRPATAADSAAAAAAQERISRARLVLRDQVEPPASTAVLASALTSG